MYIYALHCCSSFLILPIAEYYYNRYVIIHCIRIMNIRISTSKLAYDIRKTGPDNYEEADFRSIKN